MQHDSALKRRMMPSVPLSLQVENGDGSSFTVDLKLAFNMNVLADVREKCGHNLMADVFGWMDDPRAVITVLWAASIPYQPELDSDEGLEAIGEYMTLENRADSIEALLKAYAFFVRKDKRAKFQEAAGEMVGFIRTGKTPEKTASPLAESETTANPSTSTISLTSPSTTSDSASSSSAA